MENTKKSDIDATFSFRDLEPELGMGATMRGYSDSYPMTIIEIFTVGSKQVIKVQQDDYVSINPKTADLSAPQNYKYSRDPNGMICYFRNDGPHMLSRESKGVTQFTEFGIDWTKIEKNEKTNRWIKSEGNYHLVTGIRAKFHDHSF